MKRFVLALAIAALPAAAIGQGPPGQPNQPQPGAPAVAPDAIKPLPEVKGVVSWKTLGQVELVKVKDRVVPQFSDGVLKLNATEVKLQGFMMPLEMGDKQKHFVLTAMPQTCSFCLPGGPESLVEVGAEDAGQVHLRAGGAERQARGAEGRRERPVLSPDRRGAGLQVALAQCAGFSPDFFSRFPSRARGRPRTPTRSPTWVRRATRISNTTATSSKNAHPCELCAAFTGVGALGTAPPLPAIVLGSTAAPTAQPHHRLIPCEALARFASRAPPLSA